MKLLREEITGKSRRNLALVGVGATLGMAVLTGGAVGFANSYSPLSNANVPLATDSSAAQAVVFQAAATQTPTSGSGGTSSSTTPSTSCVTPLGFFGGELYTIISTTDKSIVAKDGSGKETTITVDANTVVLKAGAKSKVSDLSAGWIIRVMGTTASNGQITAKMVRAELPRADGMIKSIDTVGKSIVITSPDGSQKTVKLSAGTTITYNKATSDLSAFKVGDFVHAEGTTNADNSLNALVLMNGPQGMPGGRGKGGHGPQMFGGNKGQDNNGTEVQGMPGSGPAGNNETNDGQPGMDAQGCPPFKGGPGQGMERGALTISSISGNTIAATNQGGTTVTFTVSSATVYHDLDKTITLADLKTGMKVLIMADRSTGAAQQVIVAYDHLGGTVSAVTADKITVAGRNGVSQTINTGSTTTYAKYGKSVSASEVKTGAQIEASGKLNSDGTLNAVQIQLHGAARSGGKVTAINGSEITIQERGSSSKVIVVSAATTYRTGPNGAGSLDQIKVGSNIFAEGDLDSSGKLQAGIVGLLPAFGKR